MGSYSCRQRRAVPLSKTDDAQESVISIRNGNNDKD